MLIDTSSAATSIEAFLGGELDPGEIGAGDAGDVDVRKVIDAALRRYADENF